jgi:hypothetical protein
MNNATKSTINLYVPLALASGSAFMLYRRGEKSWQMVVAVLLGVFLLAWLITRKITSSIVPHTALPDDVGLSQCRSYNPTSLTDALYNDIDCVFCFRNLKPYQDLLALGNCEFVKVHNDWNARYRNKSNETLRQAIDGEVQGGWTQYASLTDALTARFNSLNLQ